MDWDKLTAAVKAQSETLMELHGLFRKLQDNHMAAQDAIIEEMKKEEEILKKV